MSDTTRELISREEAMRAMCFMCADPARYTAPRFVEAQKGTYHFNISPNSMFDGRIAGECQAVKLASLPSVQPVTNAVDVRAAAETACPSCGKPLTGTVFEAILGAHKECLDDERVDFRVAQSTWDAICDETVKGGDRPSVEIIMDSFRLIRALSKHVGTCGCAAKVQKMRDEWKDWFDRRTPGTGFSEYYVLCANEILTALKESKTSTCKWTRRPETGAGFAQGCGKETGMHSVNYCDGCGRPIERIPAQVVEKGKGGTK